MTVSPALAEATPMRLQVVALAAIWLSVGLAALGADSRNRSPRFPAWERSVIAGLRAANPDWDGPGIAVGLGSSPLFEGLFNAVIAAVFSLGLLLCRADARRGKVPGLIVAMCFGSGCLLGAVLGVKEGVEHL